jgi:hypothetical protein
MSSDITGNHSFTVFRSAAEEAELKIRNRNTSNVHQICNEGRVVRTSGADQPYNPIRTRPQGLPRQRSVASMREAEAYIRRHTPALPPALSTLYDRLASKP